MAPSGAATATPAASGSTLLPCQRQRNNDPEHNVIGHLRGHVQGPHTRKAWAHEAKIQRGNEHPRDRAFRDGLLAGQSDRQHRCP